MANERGQLGMMLRESVAGQKARLEKFADLRELSAVRMHEEE